MKPKLYSFLFFIVIQTSLITSAKSDIFTHYSEYCNASTFTTDALQNFSKRDDDKLITERASLIEKSFELKNLKSKMRLQEVIQVQKCLNQSRDTHCQELKENIDINLKTLTQIEIKKDSLSHDLIIICSEENVGIKAATKKQNSRHCGIEIKNKIIELEKLSERIKIEFPYFNNSSVSKITKKDGILYQNISTHRPIEPTIYSKLLIKELNTLKAKIKNEYDESLSKFKDKNYQLKIAMNFRELEFASEEFHDLEELSLYYFPKVSNPTNNPQWLFVKCQLENSLLEAENIKNLKHFGRDVAFVIASAGMGSLLTKAGLGAKGVLVADLALEATYILSIDVPEIIEYSHRCEELHHQSLLAEDYTLRNELNVKYQSCLGSLYSTIFMTIANPTRLGLEHKVFKH
jgi:hypothetical protein